MKFENIIPAFKGLEFKGIRNPLTHQGVRALAIVLGVIVVIAAVVYVTDIGKRREASVPPATTQQEATATPQLTVPTGIPTIAPLTEEATSSASPSSTRKIQRPTSTPTPTP